MLKRFCSVLLMISSVLFLYSQDISVGTFLDNYFETKNYTQETYNIAGQAVFFAYRANNEKLRIFDKAIMFTVENEKSIKPLVFFLGNTVANSEKVLFVGEIQTQIFYGWSIKIVEKNASFSTKYYTDNGVHVTEGPIFIWDKTKSRFKQFIIDKTMM